MAVNAIELIRRSLLIQEAMAAILGDHPGLYAVGYRELSPEDQETLNLYERLRGEALLAQAKAIGQQS